MLLGGDGAAAWLPPRRITVVLIASQVGVEWMNSMAEREPWKGKLI